MHNCFAVFQNDAVQLIFGKSNLAGANLELSVQIGRMQCCAEGFVELLKAFVNSLVRQLFNAQVNLIAAVKANHAVTVKQSLHDFLFGFQASSISAVAFLVALFEHAPGCGIHSLYKIALQCLAVLGSKINQYRFQLTFTKQLRHNCICLAQPIAETDAGTFSAAGSRCGPFNIAAHQRSIICIQCHNRNMYVLNVCFLFNILPQCAQSSFTLRSKSQALAFLSIYQCQPATLYITQRSFYNFTCSLTQSCQCIHLL